MATSWIGVKGSVWKDHWDRCLNNVDSQIILTIWDDRLDEVSELVFDQSRDDTHEEDFRAN